MRGRCKWISRRDKVTAEQGDGQAHVLVGVDYDRFPAPQRVVKVEAHHLDAHRPSTAPRQQPLPRLRRRRSGACSSCSSCSSCRCCPLHEEILPVAVLLQGVCICAVHRCIVCISYRRTNASSANVRQYGTARQSIRALGNVPSSLVVTTLLLTAKPPLLGIGRPRLLGRSTKQEDTTLLLDADDDDARTSKPGRSSRCASRHAFRLRMAPVAPTVCVYIACVGWVCALCGLWLTRIAWFGPTA